MRILIFHGYLLEGTGSNIYNARLAQTLVRAGHEVHLVCQERHPERFAFIDAAGDWDGGSLAVRRLRREPAPGAGNCTLYRPDIGQLLPVYVLDRYEALQARRFADCSEAELARYLEANVSAVRELAALAPPAAALANHLVMGPAILARALPMVPFAVKVHGSALEYTVKPEPERFLPYAREGLAPARGVLVGSRHTASSLWEALAQPELERRTRLGPPGVDVDRFRPRPRAQAAAGVRELASALAASSRAALSEPRAVAPSAFAREEAEAAAALARLSAGEGPLVAYVGKLIVSKGVDLLLAAWPLVLERLPSARLAIVGFGAYRRALECLAASLAAGDLERVHEIVAAGRALEGERGADGVTPGEGPGAPLRYLQAFYAELTGGARERYLAAASGLSGGLEFTGRLEHEELAVLLPSCQALVVPSTFPEAFGMVAAEAAACGVLPISAAHSGLAEVSEGLARSLPAPIARLLSFPLGDRAVGELAERLSTWLQTPPRERAQAGRALAGAVRSRWSWERVAEGVLDAARGRLEQLERP